MQFLLNGLKIDYCKIFVLDFEKTAVNSVILFENSLKPYFCFGHVKESTDCKIVWKFAET